AFLVITYVTPKLVQSGSRDFRIDLGMVFALVLVPLMALCIYFFLAFTSGLSRDPIGPRMRVAYWGYWLALMVLLVVSEKVYFDTGNLGPSQLASAVFNIGNLVFVGWALGRLLVRNRREGDRERCRMIRNIGIAFSVFFISALVFRLPPHVLAINPVIEAGFYFSYVLVPLLIVRRFVSARSESEVDPLEEHPELVSFSKRFGLSPRECEIIDLVYQGRSNAEIADQLFISIRTVTTHLSNIYQKTGIKSRVQLLTSIRDEVSDMMNTDHTEGAG
ncbi:MAG: hypothetical protein GY906_08935, partial [bacterium]|nr:hypothetical protein [bacterium]